MPAAERTSGWYRGTWKASGAAGQQPVSKCRNHSHDILLPEPHLKTPETSDIPPKTAGLNTSPPVAITEAMSGVMCGGPGQSPPEQSPLPLCLPAGTSLDRRHVAAACPPPRAVALRRRQRRRRRRQRADAVQSADDDSPTDTARGGSILGELRPTEMTRNRPCVSAVTAASV